MEDVQLPDGYRQRIERDVLEVQWDSTPEDDPYICPVCGEPVSWACGCSCIRDEDWGKMAETGSSEGE